MSICLNEFAKLIIPYLPLPELLVAFLLDLFRYALHLRIIKLPLLLLHDAVTDLFKLIRQILKYVPLQTP